MELREIRTNVPNRTYWQDFFTLIHWKMWLTVFSLMSIGHFLAPGPFEWQLYVFGNLGVLIALLGAYRVNELHDSTSSTAIPRAHHKACAVLFIAGGLSIGVVVAWMYAWWVVVLLAIGGVGMVVYNLDLHPVLHNKVYYGLIWGGLPLMFSEMLQSLNPVPTVSGVVGCMWGSVLAVLVLWTWGAMTCGRYAVCGRCAGDGGERRPSPRKCHSPVLTCTDRLTMPGEVAMHSRVLVNLTVLSIFVLMIMIAALRFL